MVVVVNTNKAVSLVQVLSGRKVWDLPVRVFHWSLVMFVSAAAGTGFLAPEWWLDIHVWIGYAIGSLVVFRIIWGFTGSLYARFSSFWFTFEETKGHFRRNIKRRPAHYTGHNPLGALMVFALLGVLVVLTLSGLVVLGGQENQGVLAGFISYTIGNAAGEIHEFLAVLLLVMIAVHLLGVLAESRIGKEKLVRAMVTGRKGEVISDVGVSLRPASYYKTIFIIITIMFAGGAGSWALLRVPPSGFIQMPPNKSYASECGDCHHAYHPSLLPKASWRRIMTGLEDHFGEDASLDTQVEKVIATYLNTFASESWDTEAANNYRHVSTENPMSLTATPYWMRRHKDITKFVFERKSVGSKGNCIACHKDAQTGRFDDQMIAIPRQQSKKQS